MVIKLLEKAADQIRLSDLLSLFLAPDKFLNAIRFSSTFGITFLVFGYGLFKTCFITSYCSPYMPEAEFFLLKLFSAFFYSFLITINPILFVVSEILMPQDFWLIALTVLCHVVYRIRSVKPVEQKPLEFITINRFRQPNYSKKQVTVGIATFGAMMMLILAVHPQALRAPARLPSSFHLLQLLARLEHERQTHSWHCEGTERELATCLSQVGDHATAVSHINKLLLEETAKEKMSIDNLMDCYVLLQSIDVSHELTANQFVALCKPADDILLKLYSEHNAGQRPELRRECNQIGVKRLFFIMARTYKKHNAPEEARAWMAAYDLVGREDKIRQQKIDDEVFVLRQNLLYANKNTKLEELKTVDRLIALIPLVSRRYWRVENLWLAQKSLEIRQGLIGTKEYDRETTAITYESLKHHNYDAEFKPILEGYKALLKRASS